MVNSFAVVSTFAIAKQSSLSVSVNNNTMSINILPASGGTFGASNNTTISVSTDNFTGYTLKISSQGGTSLEDLNENEIESISSAITESAFSTSSAYNNKWGYKPSQFITVSNNANTVVQNTNYLPAPSSLGDTIDVTTSANSTDNTYGLSAGARADTTMPAGTYTRQLVIRAVGNAVVYNINYDDNTNETVTGMPSPNPQALQIDGGTPAADSHVALSNAVPVMTTGTIRTFGGWCTVSTTYDSVTGNDECSGTTYQAGDDYPIDQTVDGTNITLYAIWLTDPFPTVWSQMGKCVFNNGTISGSECQDYTSYDFIDTGIALYSNDNYQKDYEVHFTIDSYVPSSQPDSQSTIFNDKLSSSVTASPYGGKSPGIIVRRNGSKPIEIKSTYGAPTDYAELRYVDKEPPATAYNGTDIRIFRIDGVIYTSVDNGPLVFLQDYTSFDQQFGLSAWFGAYPDNVDCTVNCTAAKRYFTGELSNMYIKLGDMPTDGILDITFNANGGTPSTTPYKIINGNALGELPTVTRSGWMFQGWYTGQDDGQAISSATVPTVNSTTYWAHWKLSVTDAQITNTDVHLSVNDTETINITNASDIEPYTLISSDPLVATVNQSTGVITAVGNGTATITMTGTMSGETRTITVAVGSLINVNFYSQGGTPSTYTWSVSENGSFSSLPEPSRPGYSLEGWYTGIDGAGTKLTTSTVFTTNTPTQYYANWEESVYVCKIATELHEESCSQTGSNGCKGTSWPNNTITYGSLVNDTTLSAGNAFNCDINYDGNFDEENERFYYFGTENGNAKFVYYKSMQDTSAVYNDALALLPTSSDPGWDNPNLVTFSGDYNGAVARFMTYPEALALCDNATSNLGINGRCLYLLEKSAFANTTITDGIWLEKQPSYNNRIQTRSRGLTHGNTTSNAPRPTIEVPIEYVEPYIEPVADYEITFNPHNGDNDITETVAAGSALGNKYPSPDPTYTDHIFQGWYTAASGGTLVTDQTIPDGDWTYHAQWKGTVALAQVSSNTLSVIEGNTGSIQVTNSADLEAFTYSSSNTSVATVDSSTGVVTGVSEGTATITITGVDSHATNTIVTVTVLDPSTIHRVTFDPRNGDPTSFADVLVGNPIGSQMPDTPTYTNHVFQRWYDTSNNNTVTSATEPMSNMTVYAEWKLDVQQAVISNDDLTLPVGGSISILISNSSDLEPYTFSSDDTSVATVNANTGVITGVNIGTTDIIMTGTQSGLTKRLEVEVTAAPVPKWTVTFNANGGTTPTPSASFQVDDGDQVGSLPTTSRNNYRFFGWYKDDGTFYDEVYEDEIIDSDVTFYARWVEDTTNFPIEFAEINECQFNGNAVISGTYCTQDKTKKFINSGIALFSTANYQKDFEIGFTVIELTSPQPVNQGTLVNSKYENSNLNYPGFVFRSVSTGPNFELTGRFSHGSPTNYTVAGSTIKRVKIVRENQVLKYSINDGTLTTWYDVTNNTHRFDTNVWFGASAQADGTTPQRYLSGKLTDMYVKLGNPTDYLIEFNPDGGSFINSSDSSRTVTIGDQLGSLPVPNPPTGNHTFIGWFDESTSPATQVTASTRPDGNKVYVAHYSYTSSNTPVEFDVSNEATRDYNTIINTWRQSPINISTFNEASPINSSTWGDTSELSEAQFWTGLKNNFESNGCQVPSYKDTATTTPNPTNWVSGAVDCSKPDAYDTKIGAELTVRLNNAQGVVVAYADADDGVIHNMIPGQTYYWEKTSDSSVYGYVSAVSNTNYSTRWVDTGVIRNTRDLGGLPVDTDGNGTVDGTLEYGRLFRGERLWSASTTELTKLGINKEYDLSDGTELASDTKLSQYVNDQVIHYNFAYNFGDENNATSNYMRARNAVTNIMTDVVDANNPKNIYFHCRIGSDRTGTVAYLLEGLLGVPDEARYEEYELTHLSGQWDRTRYYKQKSSSNNLKFVFMMGFVETTQDIYDWYMAGSTNTTADDLLIQQFRNAMIVSNNNNQNNQNSPENSPSNSPDSLMDIVMNNTSSADGNVSSGNGGSGETSGEEDDSEKSSKGKTSGSYSDPLGVKQNTEGDEMNDFDSSSALAPVLITAAAVGSAGTVAYALSKQSDDDEEKE